MRCSTATFTTSDPLHGLVFPCCGQHCAPKRHARYTPMPACRSMSFLCSERTTSLQDPPLTLRREAHSAPVTAGQRFASLRPSTSSASPFCVSSCQQLTLLSV